MVWTHVSCNIDAFITCIMHYFSKAVMDINDAIYTIEILQIWLFLELMTIKIKRDVLQSEP